MDRLSNDALQQVLQHLDWQDLLAAGAACRQLRAAAAADSPLWRRLCQRRWHGPLNTWFAPQPPQPPSSSSATSAAAAVAAEAAPTAAAGQQAIDYRALFLHDNGWAAPDAGMAVQQWAGSHWNDEVTAAQPSAAADGSTLVAVSSSRELRLLRLDASPGAQRQVRRAGTHRASSGGEQWSSLAVLLGGGGELVATGGCRGRVTLWRLPEWHSAAPAQAAAQPAATLALAANK